MQWRLADGVHWTPVDDGVVIFCRGTGAFLDLDGSAAELWTVLHRANWVERTAVEHLLNRYVVDEADAEQVVGEYVDKLERNGVLSPRSR